MRDVGVGFTVMCDTVNSFAPEILAVGEDGRDPILYFYEDFLPTFDPGLAGNMASITRRSRSCGTSLPRWTGLCARISYGGLRDPRVTILDPATGTGTFLLGIAERVWTGGRSGRGNGGACLAKSRTPDVRLRVAGRPLCRRAYRLHHALRASGARREAENPLELPRLGVYLADTLAEPGAAAAAGRSALWRKASLTSGGKRTGSRQNSRFSRSPAIRPIAGCKKARTNARRRLAGPHLGRSKGAGPCCRAWQPAQHLSRIVRRLLALGDLEIVRGAKRAGNGVVAFITNRKFLTGWPYAGLRKMMRERFDRIEIVDLRGDLRLGGPAGVDGDQGVFNIQVGTAITLAVADGSKAEGEPAEVHYHDSWTEGLFSRRQSSSG